MGGSVDREGPEDKNDSRKTDETRNFRHNGEETIPTIGGDHRFGLGFGGSGLLFGLVFGLGASMRWI